MRAAVRALNPLRFREKLSSVKVALEKLDSEMKLHHYKVREFSPNVSFAFERGNYEVRTASGGDELEECLKLRYDVFHREYKNKKRSVGVDIDKLDYVCDHLLIFDRRSEKIIGTYRLNSSLFSNTFYSTNEFHMSELLDLPGNKLELGRACIAREHRNGVVISLLWRGIVEYIQRTDTKVLFGCASIKTMEPLEIGRLTKYFAEQGHSTSEFGITPTRKYQLKQLPSLLEYLDANPHACDYQSVESQVPSLVRAYLKAGAKLAAEPAIDREFRCIDFLCILKMDEMNDAHKGKFKL
jgi:putative hemolysin